MARIFNIYFTYEDTTHNAIVSVRQTPFFTEYTLKDIHDSVLGQLPGDKIISRSKEDFIFPNTSGAPTELMKEIVRAVSSHVQTISV